MVVVGREEVAAVGFVVAVEPAAVGFAAVGAAAVELEPELEVEFVVAAAIVGAAVAANFALAMVASKFEEHTSQLKSVVVVVDLVD